MIQTKENKYSEGSIVYANEDPNVRLLVRRYVDRIYYCKIYNDSSGTELVYFEREIHSKMP
ncbi:MAG: hypothetical protein JNL60_04765 [Bacteroidia bacterium]|nr:hypothetical protein [Bacteroidia bacterium]